LLKLCDERIIIGATIMCLDLSLCITLYFVVFEFTVIVRLFLVTPREGVVALCLEARSSENSAECRL